MRLIIIKQWHLPQIKKVLINPEGMILALVEAVESISIAVVFVINNTLSILFYASSSELASISNVTKLE
jgi:hypothetical protein